MCGPFVLFVGILVLKHATWDRHLSYLGGLSRIVSYMECVICQREGFSGLKTYLLGLKQLALHIESVPRCEHSTCQLYG